MKSSAEKPRNVKSVKVKKISDDADYNAPFLDTFFSHKEWVLVGHKFLKVFKTKKCPIRDCPEGYNCMAYHSPNDRKRQDYSIYSIEPCPHLYDYWGTKKFFFDNPCPKGDDCEYAHSDVEMYYHPESYKMDPCPYEIMAKAMRRKNKQCPFVRSRAWFDIEIGQKLKNPIVKVKGNRILHKNGMATCYDKCPFYHWKGIDRRLMDDNDIISKENNQRKNEINHEAEEKSSIVETSDPQ